MKREAEEGGRRRDVLEADPDAVAAIEELIADGGLAAEEGASGDEEVAAPGRCTRYLDIFCDRISCRILSGFPIGIGQHSQPNAMIPNALPLS